MPPLLTDSGAGCRNRTCFVSLKRRVHIHICQSRKLVGDAGIEPAWSRLRGECISHLCQSPTKTWCRMLESNQHLAVIDRGLDLRANPASHKSKWCAVRELNPHLLGVGQLFWSVELPARKSGRGCRSRTCLAALIWRRSGYKPLPLPEAPPLVARDGFEPSTTAL